MSCEPILEKNGSQLLKGEQMNEWIWRQIKYPKYKTIFSENINEAVWFHKSITTFITLFMSSEKSEKHLIYLYFVCFPNHQQRWSWTVDERKNIYFEFRIAKYEIRKIFQIVKYFGSSYSFIIHFLIWISWLYSSFNLSHKPHI